MYMSETVSLEIHLKHVHSHVCDIGVGEMSVSVTTPTSPGDGLKTAWTQPNAVQHVVEWSATHAAVP